MPDLLLPGLDALIAAARVRGRPDLIEPYPDPNAETPVRVWWGVQRETFAVSRQLARDAIAEVLGGALG